jgi:hypothetical protein
MEGVNIRIPMVKLLKQNGSTEKDKELFQMKNGLISDLL